jgi:WD40 repeat protein
MPLLEREISPSAVPSRAKEWARAVSGDGRFQVVARTGGRVELHDLRQSRITDLSEAKVASIAFLPGTRAFVTGGFDRQVRLWDAVTGRALRNLGEHPDQVVAVAVSGDGSALATGSRNGTVSRWTLESTGTRADVELGAPVSCLRFAPDGAMVAVSTGSWRSSASGGIVLLDLATWTERKRVALTSPIGALAFENNGHVLAAGAWDGTVHYLGLNDFSPLLSVVSSKDAISAAGFSADTGAFPVLTLDEARTQLERERARQFSEQQAQQQLLQQFAVPTEPVPAPAAR